MNYLNIKSFNECIFKKVVLFLKTTCKNFEKYLGIFINSWFPLHWKTLDKITFCKQHRKKQYKVVIITKNTAK